MQNVWEKQFQSGVKVERKTAKCKYKDATGEHIEELEMDYGENPLQKYQEIIGYFNNSLRPNESKRTAICAEWKGEEANYYCDFTKENLMTLQDGTGLYDKMVCSHCGKVIKRYSLSGHEINKIKCKTLKLHNFSKEQKCQKE